VTPHPQVPPAVTPTTPILATSTPATTPSLRPPSTTIGAEFAGEGMSQDAALALQRAVDEGHQPWRTDPEMVAQSFVSNRFGWSGDGVTTDRTAENRVIVTYRPTGAKVGLVVAQPARHGTGGIWAVIRGYHLT
jgi:hypothetical protein